MEGICYLKSLITPYTAFNLSILIFITTFLITCEKKSGYEQLVEKELVKGVRHDTLFLGYYFGMSEEKFFNHSWELNQKNILRGDTYIRYNLDLFGKNARMEFYPEFQNGKIYKMPVEISYDGWAPWNRNLSSDSLITNLKKLYKRDYDADFTKTYFPSLNREVWVDVNGNRRITILKKDERSVQVEFLDLLSATNRQ